MSPIVAALWITLLGMGLVFIAILILWGLMALMAKIPDGPEAAEEEEASEVVESGDIPTLADTPPVTTGDQKRRAAALAVAVALALHESAPVLVPAGTDGNVSPWQSTLRAGRMSQRSQIYMRKVRG